MTFELLGGAGERGFLTHRIFGDHRGDYRYIESIMGSAVPDRQTQEHAS